MKSGAIKAINTGMQDPMVTDNELGEIKLDWKNIPSLRDLKADFEEARIHNSEHVKRIDHWQDILYVRGKHKPKKMKGRSTVQPRLARKQAEWRYASLSEPFLATTDLFTASPITFDDTLAARQNQVVLNHQFTYRINRGKFIDDYVRAAVNEGTVIVKVGWEYEDETYIDMEPVFELIPDPAFLETIQEVAALMQENPNQYEYDVPEEIKQAVQVSMQEGTPFRPVVTGEQEVEKTRIIKNQPTVEVCEYANVTIDPTCNGDLSKANGITHTFEVSKADLEKDGRYFNLDQLAVENNTINSEPEHVTTHGARNFEFRDPARKKYVLHEHWANLDIDGDGVLVPVVCSWIGNTFVRMDLNPYPDNEHPFVDASYMPTKRSVFGEPDAELLEENQQILGAVTRGMIDIMGRSANAQTGFQQGMLDPANKAKWRRGEDYEYNGSVDPRQGIFMHKFEEIPNSAQFMLNQQNQEAESLTGVKAFYGGLNSDSLGDVATSVKGVLDSASRRELGILRRLSNGIVRIGRKVSAMNGEFLSDKEVVRLTNEQFVEVRRDELNGEFDLQLKISTAEEDNVKAQELAFMTQTLGNSVDFNFIKLMLAEIFRLRKMPDLSKKIENFQPEPDPMQEQIQQLEIQKLQAEIAFIQAQAHEKQAEGQLDQAKVGTEQAKAEKLKAETDAAALDFVETERGVKQERNLQLAKAQGESNMELERLKQGNARQNKREDNQTKLNQTFLQSYLNNKQQS